MVKIFGTFGPNCKEQETLEAMIEEGLTGMRVNLSHTTLQGCKDKLDNYRAACEAKGVEPTILVDMHGPQMRTGWLHHQVSVAPDDLLILRAKKGKGEEYPIVNVAPVFLESMEVGDQIAVRDGEIQLEVVEELPLMELPPKETDVQAEEEGDLEESAKDSSEEETVPEEKEEEETEKEETTQEEQEEPAEEETGEERIGKRKQFLCRCLRGGTIRAQQTVKIKGKEVYGDVLTMGDMETLDLVAEYGVNCVMQPFVRDGEDIRIVREALLERGLQVRIFAKIETLTGLSNLDSIIEEADEVVIARGDLGNSMPLWELARVQKEISDKCLAAGRDFMVVTQMLQSMMRNIYPTRAEVSDIFHAVTDGASSVMVTGETSVGAHPVEVIRFLARTVKEAEKYLGRDV